MGRDVGDSTVEDLDQRIQASREVRRPFEGQWLLNIAFFVGNQWLRFDGLMLHPYMPEDELEPLIVDNRIQPAVRTEIAKLTKTQPAWVGVPRDGTDKEISSARLRERVFEHYWRVLRAKRRLRRALLWSRIGTAGFWKLTWDANAGGLMRYMARPNPETGQLEPVTLADGRLLTPGRLEEAKLSGTLLEGLVEQQKRTGDVRLDLRSPFTTYPDALAEEEGLETCEYFGEESVYSCNQLWKMLGATDDARAIVEKLEASVAPTAGIAEGRMPGSNFGIGKRGGAGYRGVKVREYWSLPNYDHPDGRHVIWIPGGQVLLEEENPYPWLPYVMFAGTPVPGRFWPDCMTTQGVPLNTELNKTRSQIAANGERVGNAPLAQAAESLDEENEWHGLPGERLIYRDTQHLPQFLDVPEMPAYVQNQIEWNQQGLKEVFRQYEVSQGTVPAGVTAASAISLLQESGDTVLSPDIDDASDSLLDAGKMVLGLVKTFSSDERIARVAGDEGGWDIVRFRGEQLADVDLDEVQIGSGIPDSRAAKQAAIERFLNMLIQNGQAPKPRDLRRILRDFEIGGLDHILATISKDEDQIQDENRRLLAGEGLGAPQPVITNGPAGPIPIVGPDGKPLFAGLSINPYDQDELHIEGHEELCKSPAFRELLLLPNGQMIQQGIVAHIELHKARLAQRAAAMGQAQAQDTPSPAPAPVANGTAPFAQ